MNETIRHTAERILDLLQRNAQMRSDQVAQTLELDPALIEQVLTQELIGHVRKQPDGSWQVDRERNTDPSHVPFLNQRPRTTETESTGANDLGSTVARLAAYYLDVLGHDADGGDISVLASSRGDLDYLELSRVPFVAQPEKNETESAAERAEVLRIWNGGRRNEARSAATVGYPVYVHHIRSKSGWHKYVVKPLYLFDLDPGRLPELVIRGAQFPRLNLGALGDIASCDRYSVIEESLALSSDLGVANSEIQLSTEELFRRLPGVRKDWPWVEQLEPAGLCKMPPLAAVRTAGIYNRAVFLMSPASKYTQGLESELNTLKNIKDSDIRETALGVMLSGRSTETGRSVMADHELLRVVDMNTEQLQSVQSALTQTLTVITGPPGTGKSQVVTQTVVNAVWHKKRILVASKNNKAVDVVEERVNSLADFPALFRLGNTELSARLSEYLESVLSGNVTATERREFDRARESYDRIVSSLLELGKKRSRVTELRNRVDAASRQVEDARMKLGVEKIDAFRQVDTTAARASLWLIGDAVRRTQRSSASLLVRLFWSKIHKRRDAEASTVALSQAVTLENGAVPLPNRVGEHYLPSVLSKYITEAHSRLETVDRVQQYLSLLRELTNSETLETINRREWDIGRKLIEAASELWARWLQLLPDRVDDNARRKLGDYAATLRMISQIKSGQIPGNLWRTYFTLSEEVSPHLSAWAITSLSAKGRVPLKPGVFDIVIIDEASQCDIASALPLLYRARSAVIIGDPNQLRHISGVAPALDAQLLDKHGLTTMPQWAYSTNSLYDLAQATVSGSHVITLVDHHRSHSDIIEFSNGYFYAGRLRVATKYDRLATFPSIAKGITWRDVTGRTRRPEEGGAVNHAEAEAVVDEIARILSTDGFCGTIGVVTPFRAQANQIRQRLSELPSLGLTESSSQVLVDTVHKFQGDERDLMILSPVVSQGSPESALRFLETNKHLFNVAITRARSSLVVIGDREYVRALPARTVLRSFLEYVERTEVRGGSALTSAGSSATVYPAVTRRESVSEWEEIFYAALAQRGIKAIPQFQVEKYTLDFAILRDGRNRKLAIEIDGEQYHRDWNGELVARDRIRNLRLNEMDWDVMRFWVYQVRDDLDGCVDRVSEWVDQRLPE